MLFLIGTTARAAEMCVNSSALLQAALSFGQSQQSNYTIKIVQGVYSLDFNGAAYFGFTFSAPTTIEGGYNANCTARVVNAANTSVDFGGAATEVTFEQLGGNPTALLAFDGMTLKHGGRLVLHAGLQGQISDDPGSVHLSNLRFTDFNNTDTSTGQRNFPLSMLSHAAEMRLENVQIDHIVQQNGTTSCAIELQSDEDSQMRLIGTTIDLSNSKKLCFGTWISSGDYVVDIYNSIVWGSDGGVPQIATGDNFHVASSFVIHVVNSLFNDPVSGVASVQIINPLHTDPQWTNGAAGNYHLLNTSPAVNSGTPVVPNGGLEATDIEGNARWIGSMPDRGAYESPFNDATNYQVTTTADSGAGSLRDAITQANSLPNPGVITFA
ncbi:MAG: choice-of-anchor Q domain-containing protein, partial [Dokdonella sp.]